MLEHPETLTGKGERWPDYCFGLALPSGMTSQTLDGLLDHLFPHATRSLLIHSDSESSLAPVSA